MKIIEYQIQRFDVRMQEYNDHERSYKKNPTPENKTKLEGELKKLNKIILKQDKLLYISFTILLNLAEDFTIEKKMKKRKIVSVLIRMLERNDFHLLLISLLFLRKLSIVGENKNQMIEDNIIKKLGRFFSCNNHALLQLTLGLIKNLCFEQVIREDIEAHGYIPKIIDLLKQSNFRFMAIVILYLLTIDEKIRVTFSYTSAISLLIKLIIHFPEPQIGKELIAVGINLTASSKNSSKITEDELQKICDRALQYEDVNVFKFIKNIAVTNKEQHLQDCLTLYLPDFIKAATQQNHNDEIKVELLGLMANICIGNEWEELCDHDFIEFLDYNMTVGQVEDDVLLESIMLCSNLASDKKVAELLSENKMFDRLVMILYEKAEDDEIVTQTLYAVYKFLKFGLDLETCFTNETFQMQLLNMIHEKNSKIRKMNDRVIDILKEYNSEMNERVKERRFYQHNKEWVESMEEYEKNFVGNMDSYNVDGHQNYMNQALMDAQQDNELNEAQIDPRMWDDSEEDED